MLFNPKAERLTLLQLRNMAINTREDLRERLNECLREKRFAKDMYVQCRKDDHDQQVFASEMKYLDDYVEQIDKTAYRQITHHLLATESLYGFGTPLPITPLSAIEVIMPNYWLSFDLNPEKSEAFGHGLHYVGIFFQRQEDVPAETIALIKDRQNITFISASNEVPPPISQADYYKSPYLKLMLDAAAHFDIVGEYVPLKKVIIGWFETEAASRNIHLSERMLELMATAIRPPEAQNGGLKKKRLESVE